MEHGAALTMETTSRDGQDSKQLLGHRENREKNHLISRVTSGTEK